MKIDWPYNPTRTEANIVVGLVALAAFYLGSVVGAQQVNVPMDSPPPMKVQAPEPPLAALGDADKALLGRLLPHIRQAADERITAQFQAVADDLQQTDPKLGAPVGGFGSTLAAAIAWFVKKLVVALIAALIVSVLLSLLWAYWYYPAGFVAMWLATTALVSALVAKKVKS